MIDINELRRLAQAATPGPWINHGRQPNVAGLPHSAVAAKTLLARVYSEAYGDVEQETANASFIAAANPATISELLDRLEAAEKSDAESLAMYRKARDERDALRAKIEAAEKERDNANAAAAGVALKAQKLEEDRAIDTQRMAILVAELNGAERERDALRAEVIHIKEVEFPRKAQAVADGWRGKCERLEAKIAEMEKQEPYAFAVNFPETSRVELVRDLDEVYEDLIYEAHEVRKLYALPGAQPAPGAPWVSLAERMPNPDKHDRVLIYTEGYDFGGEQVFDVKAEALNECRYIDPDEQPETCKAASHWMPHPRNVIFDYAARYAQPAPSVPTALLVAAADLVAQMEIVSRVGFVDTPNDKDSCAAFCVAEGTWLELMSAVESLASALAAAPEAKP